MDSKKYKVWYWENGVERILYHGTSLKRARISAKLWSKDITNIETDFD